MESGFANPTRRTVLKMAWGTVTVVVTPVSAFGWKQDEEVDLSWSGRGGQARHRIDGLAKVLGKKIYARDFRAKDMDGWPDWERVALVLYATHANRPLLGVDTDFLPESLRPFRVDAEMLQRDFVGSLYADTAPKGWTKGFFAERGQLPGYLGQPIAILIFENAKAYRAAHRLLQFRKDVVHYGEPSEPQPVEGIYPNGNYLTYLEGQYSRTKYGKSNPFAEDPSENDLLALETRLKIEKQIEEGVQGSEWRRISGFRSTQRIVPMFMEPESGLGWLDGKTLHMVLGTQSPNGDVQDGLTLLEKSSFQVDEVRLVSCYPGGGFGGRDVSPFTPTLMLAAAYSSGPVRISHDRFTQFQAGLTQLPAKVQQEFCVDEDGNFHALSTKTVMPAGGRNNYSQFVAGLAGYSAGGAYFFPRAVIDATAEPTHDILAGSMRGFGGVQAAFAMETMVEKIARELEIDPIELRSRNALTESKQTVTGAPLTEPMQIEEICKRAAAHPLWTQRETHKVRALEQGKLYGVGFALANQAYGTGSDGVLADLVLERDGRILVRTTAIDMGQGSATSLALAPAQHLGSNAYAIEMGRVAIFDVLDLTTSLSHHHECKDHPGHEPSEWDENPKYTASISMSSSACITAFQQFHAVSQAARVLFRVGVWPAAVAKWGRDPGDSARQKSYWKDGKLHAGGLPALTLAEIAETLHARGGVCETMVHAYFAGRWVRARFEVDGISAKYYIDGLVTRRAGSAESSYDWHRRSDVEPPEKNSDNYGRSLYAPSATLVALTVNPQSGAVRLEDIYTYLDAGKIHQPDLVSGQYQGGVAMGVGYALLENLPRGEGGPGGGRWNLNRYHVPLATDLPLLRTKLELIEPEGPNPTAKGIAEAVLCPVPPAIANAITDATGHFFETLPITPKRIREALQG